MQCWRTSGPRPVAVGSCLAQPLAANGCQRVASRSTTKEWMREPRATGVMLHHHQRAPPQPTSRPRPNIIMPAPPSNLLRSFSPRSPSSSRRQSNNSPRNWSYRSPVMPGSPYRSDRNGVQLGSRWTHSTADVSTSQTLSRPPAQRDVLVRSPKRNNQYDAKKG